MTPEERNLINELFDRIATLENAPRDPAAEQAIYDGFQRAPNAAYALVQTVLVQDEVLKRAEARIRELEAGRLRRTRAARHLVPRQHARDLGLRRTAPRRLGSLGQARHVVGLAQYRHAQGDAMQGEPMPASGPMSAPMSSPPMALGRHGRFVPRHRRGGRRRRGRRFAAHGRPALDDGAAARRTARSIRRPVRRAARRHGRAATRAAAISRARPGLKTWAARPAPRWRRRQHARGPVRYREPRSGVATMPATTTMTLRLRRRRWQTSAAMTAANMHGRRSVRAHGSRPGAIEVRQLLPRQRLSDTDLVKPASTRNKRPPSPAAFWLSAVRAAGSASRPPWCRP